MKQRARRIMRLWSGRRAFVADERAIGVNASTHCRPCSGWMDQPGREVPPPRERPFTARRVAGRSQRHTRTSDNVVYWQAG